MAYNYQPYRESNSVINYKNKQDTATRNYNNYANTNYSAGAGGLGSQIDSAQSKLNSLYNNNNLSQQFKYSKQNQYNDALNAISNRKAFSYDLANDQLFQQAKQQYQAMGKTAMADTIGQASAMTGGYGNSYATTAGAQAYNNYLQQLNNSIGDYYAMALSTYNGETDRLNGVFNAYSADRSTEANEWSNNWNVYNQLYSQYYNQFSDMLNKDMSAWQQKGSNLYNAANLASSQYNTASSNDINTWSTGESMRAEQASQEETERANRIQEAYQNAQLAETIRANQAQEKYNRDKLNADTEYNNNYLNYLKKKDDENSDVSPQSTANTSKIINLIANQQDSNRWLDKSKQKSAKEIVEDTIEQYTDSMNLSNNELAYLYEYFGLS